MTLKDGPITKIIPKNVTKKSTFTVNKIFSLSIIIENKRTYIGQRQKIRIVKLTSINITEVNNPSVNNNEPADIDKKYFSQIYKQREGYYLDLADFVIDTNRESLLSVAMNIKDKIISHEIID